MSELQEQHEALADELTGLIRDVVMLHRPHEDSSCAGCRPPEDSIDPYQGLRMWDTCPTIALIKEGMGP